MASVQDLKRRVRSVKNTRKITKAMELVASARLRRAQTRIEAMRPYAETMRELIAGVGRASSSVRGLPLLQQRDEVKTVAVVALTGDRGLAGPFNAQIIRRAFALERQLRGEGKQVRFIAVGKKGRSTSRVPRLRGSSATTPASPTGPPTRRAGDRAPRRRALHRGRDRQRAPRLQRLRLAARADRDRAGAAADLGRHPRDRRGGAARRRDARRLHLRARAGGDPRPAAAGLPRDAGLSGRCSSRPRRSRAPG